MSYWGVRCNACKHIFVMQQVIAGEFHPEAAVGQIIHPLCCPYCGEFESFSLRDGVKSIIDAVITFAAEERASGPNEKPSKS